MQSTRTRRDARRRQDIARVVGGSPGHPLLAIQRSAGNRAVSTLVRLQRDGVPSPDGRAAPRLPGSLLPGPEFFAPKPIPQKVRTAVEDWLDLHKFGILLQKDAGSISMPEVIARMREEVAGAGGIEVYQLEQLARQRLGHAAPPPTRGRQTPGGQASELAARLKNILGKKVEVGNDAANLVISVSGAVGKLRAGGIEATAEAGAGGVGGKVKIGRGTVSVAPDEVGLKTTIPLGGSDGVFAAKLAKDGDTWSKWSASFSFPVVGRSIVDARPATDAIGASVRKAEAAIRDIAGHLQEGGMPTDAFVLERIGQVTPAISKVGGAVKTQDPGVSVRIGASGGPRDVGSHRVQEATVGVSVVVAF